MPQAKYQRIAAERDISRSAKSEVSWRRLASCVAAERTVG